VLVDNFLIGHDTSHDLHAVVADNVGAGYLAAEHLLRLGHRRIAMLAGSRTYRKFTDRLRGYEDALAAAGLAVDPALLPPPVDGEEQYGASQMRELLALAASLRPTAIVMANDRLASRALAILHRAGVQVPGEMSVVGIGDTEEATSPIPHLTTVSVPRREMGTLGVRRLADLLAGTAPSPFKAVLYTHLVERESAGPPPR
jgi:LacI family transcriptional regulator